MRAVWICVGALILTSSACAHGRSGAGAAQPAGGTVVLNVSNHYGQPIEVFVVSQGASYRLGTVSPGIDSRFVVRSVYLRNGLVEFVAEPGGGEVPVRSGRMMLAPGNVVDFNIADHLSNSTTVIRP